MAASESKTLAAPTNPPTVYLMVTHPAYGTMPGRPTEYLGPFDSPADASAFRLHWGPAAGVCVECDGIPDGDVYTPEDFMAYQRGRGEGPEQFDTKFDTI